MLLQALPRKAVDELVRTAGAATSSPLVSLELRQLGGELGCARPGSGAFAAVDAGYALYAVGIAPMPAAAAAVTAHVENVTCAMSPWAAERTYLNFSETHRDPRKLWAEQAHNRLLRIKAAVDPTNIIRSNHPLA
jgi:Berberine and berberine like